MSTTMKTTINLAKLPDCFAKESNPSVKCAQLLIEDLEDFAQYNKN